MGMLWELLGRHHIFSHLASCIATIETKLLVMNGQVFQVLKAYNVNAKVMDMLNATVESFMQQLLAGSEEGVPIIGNTLQVKPILKAVVSKSPKDMGAH